MIVAVCFSIISVVTGYFVALNVRAITNNDDPRILNIVHPYSVRAVQGASADK